MKLSRIDRAAPGWRPGPQISEVQDRLAEQLGRGDWSVEVVWVEDEEIRRLNRDYRGKDAVTDVLSFSDLEAAGAGTPDLRAGEAGARSDLWRDPATPPEEPGVGEIVMAADFIHSRCLERGWNPDDEIAMLTVHGLLHVLGWDHEDDDEGRRMRDLEEERLADCGRSHPLRREGRE